MIKKILSLITIVLLAVHFGGCGITTADEKTAPVQEVQENADVGISNLCEAILHRDDESILKAMLSRDELERNMLLGFTVQFQESSGGIFTDEQANRIGKQYLELLKKVNVKTNILSGDNHTARVEVKVNQFDFNDLNKKEMQAELKKRSYFVNNETELVEELTKIYIKNLSSLEPKGEASFVVDCYYDEGRKLWQPNDRIVFEASIVTSAFKFQP